MITATTMTWLLAIAIVAATWVVLIFVRGAYLLFQIHARFDKDFERADNLLREGDLEGAELIRFQYKKECPEVSSGMVRAFDRLFEKRELERLREVEVSDG